MPDNRLARPHAIHYHVAMPFWLAAALLLQETPADLLKRLEESLAQAPAFAVKATVEIKGKRGETPTEARLTATLKSKGKGMALFDLQGQANGKPITPVLVVSDGKKGRYKSGGLVARADHELPLGTWSRTLYVRAGLFASASALVRAVDKPQDSTIERTFRIAGVSGEADERVGGRLCKVLTLAVVSAPGEPPIKSRIWIDPQKMVVVKRETTLTSAEESGTVTETYTEISQDDLPDRTFQVD